MAVERIPGSMDGVNDVLVQLFSGHGVEAARHGDGVVFPAHPGLWANGEAFRMYERIAQLDVRLGVEPGRMLVESVSGIGMTDGEQILNGLEAFTSTTFHVLLTAFFGLPECHGTERLEWEIGGRKRVVFLGVVGTRFGFPPGPDGQPDLRFYHHFERHLKAQPLPPGTHWVRLYQMRFRGEATANEVLLDNDPWPEMQEAMAAFEWPATEKHYDVRLFLVIMDPEE